MDYSKSQRRAIDTIDRNLQIIACAGSGKTEVISARIVNILQRKKSDGITPANIVAFTFTQKAAGELKDRIQRLCVKTLGTDTGLADMFVGTIHGYCLNLLQEPPVFKFLKYSVLSDVQQRLLIDRNSRKSGLQSVPLLKGGYLQRWKDSALYQGVLEVLGEGAVTNGKVPKAVWDSVHMYDDLCREKKYLDYTSIIREAVREIKGNPELRAKISGLVRFLVVDEYQDVNPLQEKLIREIFALGANLCVVGDDDQTIYQWRGSDVGNIIGFQKRYPNVETVPLNENYRSSAAIVLTARQVIERNPERLPKKMESADAQPFQRGDILAMKFDSITSEAEWISSKVSKLIGTPYQDKKDSIVRGLTYSDIAILLRSVRNDAAPIVSHFEDASIPYVIGGMNGLFDTPEIQAVRKIFYFLADHTPKKESRVRDSDVEGILVALQWGLDGKSIASGKRFLLDRKKRIGNGMDAELYLQRVYLDLLEKLGVREENIDRAGNGRSGEIIFYNLGKFSQLISDFETINFNSSTKSMYSSFASFLEYEAASYYPEGWEDSAYARPDAVQIMTVHQAKGMQWPVVFIPCLRQNRFPSRRQGGRSVWHVIPDTAVKKVDRYKGTEDDERRLYYVAATRAERYLFCSWAPIPTNQQQRNVSKFFRETTESEYVLTKESKLSSAAKTTPKQRREEVTLPLTFSELKYYFDCPYLFKLRFLYGFDAPINRAIGYGKSLHDALAEIHSRSLLGDIPPVTDVPRLVSEHLHLPFANSEVRDNLEKAAVKALSGYLQRHGENLRRLEHVEKGIELKLSDGIVVTGRIDLIRRTDTKEIAIVDFKSDERAQAEDITMKQLHVYAVGYEKLTGKNAQLLEVHNLDKGGVSHREEVDPALIADTLKTIAAAGKSLREDDLPRLRQWGEACRKCDISGICRSRPNGSPK